MLRSLSALLGGDLPRRGAPSTALIRRKNRSGRAPRF